MKKVNGKLKKIKKTFWRNNFNLAPPNFGYFAW